MAGLKIRQHSAFSNQRKEHSAISTQQSAKAKSKPKIRQHSAFSNQQSAKAKTKSNPNRKTKPRKPHAKSRRKARVHNPYEKITTFPQVEGKVVREVCFSHDEPNNVLIIDFKDRTALYFDINPEALILPLEVSAHYVGETRSARKTWAGLAGEKKQSALSSQHSAKR